MTDIQIKDEDLTGFQGKVAVVTGGSGGIGLATVGLLRSLGASVVSGDIQSPSTEGDVLFVQTDARNWSELLRLFKTAKEKYGCIDYVFANAGVGPRADYLALAVDENGDPEEPSTETLDTNLSSVINTATLAIHYMKAYGGSLVIMASSTGLQPFRAVDYSTSKAGVIGLCRSFARLVEAAGLPVRVNGLSPSWTATQVLPNLEQLLNAVSEKAQSPSSVARAAAYLLASKDRHGDMIYVHGGKCKEIEKAILNPAYNEVKGDAVSDDMILAKVMALGP